LREGDWKLIVFKAKDGSDSKIELFNIAEAPNEENDLAEAQVAKVVELRKKLKEAATIDRDAVALKE